MVQTDFDTTVDEIDEVLRQIEAARNANSAGDKDSALTHVDNIATIMEENDREGSAQTIRAFESDWRDDDLPDEVADNVERVFDAWEQQMQMIQQIAQMQESMGGGSPVPGGL